MVNHTKIISEIEAQLKPVFELSKQSIYVYLDDANKICNKNFSDLLGYESPEDWSSVKENFPTAFVDPKSQNTLISAFQDAIQNGSGSTVKVDWKKKLGGVVNTTVILVPISINGHIAALHFIE